MARTKAFDPEEKLSLAMEQFWHHGYDGTSMQQLVEVMGINRFSIYATYGDKKALFIQTVEHYADSVFLPSLRPLYNDEPGLNKLQSYFEALSDNLTKSQLKAGCFLQNVINEPALNEFGLRGFIKDTVKQLGLGIRTALKEAVAKNEISRQVDIEQATQFLVMQVQALIVLQKQVPAEQLKKNIIFLFKQISRW